MTLNVSNFYLPPVMGTRASQMQGNRKDANSVVFFREHSAGHLQADTG